MAVASAPAIAKSVELTRYATIFGSVTWVKYSCGDLEVDNVETYTKIKDTGVEPDESFTQEFQDLTTIVMITPDKEKDRPKLCELIFDHYGPRGRIMPGLVKRSR